MNETKVSQQINDVVGDNVKKLAQLFPTAVKDGEVDFEALKEELGSFTEVGAEKYELTWAGKADAKRIAREDIIGKTLKYIPEESKDADTTENLYIEGDNLEVLKLLRQNYYGAIKMIYIDPPYNTGNDFVYNDSFGMSKEESDIAEGNADELGERYTINRDTQNRYHANWLNMMYPRLKIAKDLLCDDGVIFISIDDTEQSSVKQVCDEIFGEQNFVTSLIWAAGRKNDSKYVSVSHEYILCYVKSIQVLNDNKVLWRQRKQGLEDIYKVYEKLKKQYGTDYKKMTEQLKQWYKGLPDTHAAKNHSHYNNIDERGIYFPSDISWPGGGGPKYEVLHPVTHKPVKIPNRGWVYPTPERMQEVISQGLVHFGENENSVPCKKTYLSDGEYSTPYSVFYKDGRASTKRLRTLMDGMIFQNPKDEEIIADIIEFTLCGDNTTILDFFSGSATTAHAVMQMNVKDNAKRKFIMVQLQEECDDKSEAYKLGYKNICEIGKERIRRAGDKLKEEHPDADLDIGFKVFRVADTNIKWNSLMDMGQLNVSQIESTPDLMDFMPNAKDIDVVYELMLRQRDVALSESVELLSDIGSRTYLYASSFLVCLETEVTESLVEKIAAIDPLPIKFIFRDSAFKDDIALKDETFRRLKALVEKNSGESKPTYTVEFI